MPIPPNPNQAPQNFQLAPSGPSNALEYMASGLPYVTESSVGVGELSRIDFPFVTSFITVKNAAGGGTLYFGFTENGVQGTNRFEVTAGQTVDSQRIRVRTLYISGSTGTSTYTILAGLTQIPTRNFWVLTGSVTGFSSSQTNVIEFGYPGIG